MAGWGQVGGDGSWVSAWRGDGSWGSASLGDGSWGGGEHPQSGSASVSEFFDEHRQHRFEELYLLCALLAQSN